MLFIGIFIAALFAYTWEALREGIALDVLPEVFDLRVEGIEPSTIRMYSP